MAAPAEEGPAVHPTWRHKHIGQFPRRHAQARPDELAYISADARLTWAELNRRVNSVAATLARSLFPGDRLAIVAGNSHRYWEVQYAAAKIGVVTVPINHRLLPHEIAGILDDVGAAGLFLDLGLPGVDLDALLRPAVRTVLLTRGSDPRGLDYERTAADPDAPEPDDPSPRLNVIAYTSGTSGRPKGAMISHESSITDAYWFASLFELGPDDRWLGCMPAYVFRAGRAALAPAVVGACTVMLDFDERQVLDAIGGLGITHAMLAPIMVDRLLALPDCTTERLRPLRRAWLGGSAANPAAVARLAETLDGEVGLMYGMTEAAGISSAKLSFTDDPAQRRRLGSAGRPAPQYDLRILDDAGREVARGDVGQIAVRGQSVMLGYWDGTGEPGGGLTDGWLHTGDLARLDDDGYLYIVDRRTDIIITGGLNVYSAELERVLSEHPGIRECAVVGVPNPEWGESVAAVVVGDISRDEVVAFCRARLAGFKRPRVVELRDELPRNAMGKVEKLTLRAQLAGETVRT
jgi:acyl-CoA synthetase (AMP-forming)/AMP-acid ligase II